MRKLVLSKGRDRTECRGQRLLRRLKQPLEERVFNQKALYNY